MMEKIWKKAVSSRFPDLVIDLEVCNNGMVRKITTGYMFIPQLNKDGYYVITRNSKTIPIHHLVAETFIKPRPEGMVIDHIDGKKSNNNSSNLRYLTNLDNIIKGNSNDNEFPNIRIIEKLNRLNNNVQILNDKITKILEHLNNKIQILDDKINKILEHLKI